MAKDILVNYNNEPSYTIHIRNSFDDLCHLLKEDLAKEYNKICIVSDSNVAKLYLETVSNSLKNLDSKIFNFTFEAGEASKNLDTVNKLYEELIINYFDRHDLLIALGGGVVGDLTGFAAATYLRGIDFIQIPTTLLSQVDSSIGGKTGVDYLQYKNMVGAFYMPKMVYINLSVLKTLPEEQFICGMGEVIKHGFIRDKGYYSWIKENASAIKALDEDAIEYVVSGSCNIKREVVEIDPKEKGIRAYLNFGHTIGHAVEKLSDFSLTHGQCVALGMISALYLSYKKGSISDMEYDDAINTIKSLGFIMSLDSSFYDANDILKTTKSDKKMVGNKVKFVYLEGIGNASIYTDFSDQDLLDAINILIK